VSQANSGIIHKKWSKRLIILILIIGVFFRFVNIENKIYWADENYTSFRINGYLESEFKQQVYDGQIREVAEIQKYQRPHPEKGLGDVINALARRPEHSPLYFLMASLGVRWFGPSIAVTRTLAAIISLLAFPCLYWLCRELFKSPITAWIAIALFAVSPFHVLYAQEARPYSLFTVAILLSSAALLQGMRLKTKGSWGIYAASIAMSIYTHLFFILVAIGHGIYVLALEKFRFSKGLRAYLLASCMGFLAFIPWVIVVVTRPWFGRILTKLLSSIAPNILDLLSASTLSPKLAVMAAAQTLPPFFWEKNWLLNLSRSFLDLNYIQSDRFPGFYLLAVMLIVIIIIYAIYHLINQSPKKVWLFILTLMGTTAIALMIVDLILGDRKSTISRYLIPSYLGIQIAVTYLLARKIMPLSGNNRDRTLWKGVAIGLIACGIISCGISSQAYFWWNKGWDESPIAVRINQTPQPLLISDTGMQHILSISYLLDPKVRLQLVVEPNVPKITKGFSDIFLYRPSETLIDRLSQEKSYQIEPVRDPGWDKPRLWKLEQS